MDIPKATINCAKCNIELLDHKNIQKYWVTIKPIGSRGMHLCEKCQEDFALYAQNFINEHDK
jgi:hypothetical protein